MFSKRSSLTLFTNLDHKAGFRIRHLESQRPDSANIFHRLLPDARDAQIPSVVFALANVVLGILDDWAIGGEPLLKCVIGLEDFSLSWWCENGWTQKKR